MAWFDDPKLYYAVARPDDSISQGDIVIAASVIVCPGLAEVNVAGPRELDDARKVTLWHAGGDATPAAPALSAEVRWGLAMVVPHPCAMEKEWNERVEFLLENGVPQSEAEAQAIETPGLDPFISVAPIFPIERLEPSKRTTVTENNRLGFFPICPDEHIPSAYVDLNQVSTLREELIRVPMRVRTLSPKARARLQLSLSQFYAWRAKSKLGEIEAAVGRSIEDVHCVAKAGKLIARFVLDDGSTLVLEGNRRPETTGPITARPPRT